MGSSPAPIHDGFDYQALWFWLNACELLQTNGGVRRVGYEVGEYDAFDDVAVEYDKPLPDGTGQHVTGTFFSIKYSVHLGKALTANSLGEPSLINATSFSFLERLRNAVKRMDTEGQTHNFALVAPWSIPNDDPLAKLVNTQDGSIRTQSLFDGTGQRGVMGALRNRWTEHLGLSDEEYLKPILRRLRILVYPQTTALHMGELSIRLESVKLMPIDKTQLVVPYFPLVQKLRREGLSWFDRATLLNRCKENQLVCDPAQEDRKFKRLGVRSFLHLAQGLGDETDHVLCLLDHFEGRKARHPTTWTSDIPSKLSDFFQQHVSPNEPIELHLHCLGSTAFLAGYLLEPGLGSKICIVQRGYGKPAERWSVEQKEVSNGASVWTIAEHTVGLGKECAVVASVTHRTRPDVLRYLTANLPCVGKVLIAEPPTGSSQLSVLSGSHAFSLAEQLKNEMTDRLSDRTGTLHLFWAAPNAFAFYLGQLARPLGQCRLYEFDFDGDRTYTPSLEISPKLRLNFTPC